MNKETICPRCGNGTRLYDRQITNKGLAEIRRCTNCGKIIRLYRNPKKVVFATNVTN